MADPKSPETKLPDHPKSEELRKQREAQEDAQAEADELAASSQPTPTQLENDMAKLGIPIPDKPEAEPKKAKKADEADRPGSYTTRETTPTAKK